MGFYSREELEKIGFESLGDNVLISTCASIYMPEKMKIGNNVRIDDFCFLLGKIEIGNYVHVAPYSNLVGADAGIEMQDFSGVSSRVSIYAVTDDYSGAALTNPTVPSEYTNVKKGKVVIERHSIVGASSVVLPGVAVREGSSCGAMSLINKSTDEWSINVGIPAKKIGERKKDLLKLEQQFLDKQSKFAVGKSKTITRVVQERDVELFADVSGDYNPIHLDENYAKNTMFGRRIAHGMLSASFISAVLGTEFPGIGTVYLEQKLKFLAPVYIGETLKVSVSVKQLLEKGRAVLDTNIENQSGKRVVEGEAVVKLPQ